MQIRHPLRGLRSGRAAAGAVGSTTASTKAINARPCRPPPLGLATMTPSGGGRGSRLTCGHDPFIEIRADQRVNGVGCCLVIALVASMVVPLVVGSNMISSDIWRPTRGGYGGLLYLWRR
jgi:hypothetical protein